MVGGVAEVVFRLLVALLLLSHTLSTWVQLVKSLDFIENVPMTSHTFTYVVHLLSWILL